MRLLKKVGIICLVVTLVTTIVPPLTAGAIPAPELTKVSITDMTYEDKTGDIYVEVTYKGRPSTTRVECNGRDCPEDISYRYTTFGSDGIETGGVRYFKTKYNINSIKGIATFDIYAEAQTMSYPRRTISARRIFPNEYK